MLNYLIRSPGQESVSGRDSSLHTLLFIMTMFVAILLSGLAPDWYKSVCNVLERIVLEQTILECFSPIVAHSGT